MAEGSLIKTFAFRGATHLMTPEEGSAYLALRAASRMWERKSWQSYYGLTSSDWPVFRQTVREALDDGPLTHDELGAAITARPDYRHLDSVFAEGAYTLLKPLAWQGDLCFGPPRDGRATFQRLDTNPCWPGLPELDDAGMRAAAAYLRTYGPATADRIHYWLGEGLGAGRRRIQSWITALGDRLAVVELEGEPTYVMDEDLEGLSAATATTALRLLPGHDQWVLGPGTADAHVVPPSRRALVTRGANLVTTGGVVSGTWAVNGDQVTVAWFAEAGPAPQDALDQEVDRLATILGRPVRGDVRTA